MEFHPTYDEYRSILSNIIKTGKLRDYIEAQQDSEFIILRHDIEFSIERALAMAEIEHGMGVCSTYFVQIRSNAYNAYSIKNVAMLRQICEMGHYIGLHYHIGTSIDPDIVSEEIQQQCKLLEIMLGFSVDRYSMHRPQKETQYYATAIPGLINAYGPDYFTFAEELDERSVLRVKYISDAKHRWNYGTPDSATLRDAARVQLLVHPDFWSENTPGMRDNFAGLIREHTLAFTDTIDNECHHFSEFRSSFEEKA